MLSTKPHYRVRPTLEALEDRCVPAGNVTASLGDSNWGPSLLVTGDNQANDIRVVVDGLFDVRIEGQNGTTVNGQASVSFSQSREPLVVDLKAGDDNLVVEVPDSPSPAYLPILDLRTGLDDDSVNVLFANSYIYGDRLTVDTGKGSDVVTVNFAGVDYFGGVYFFGDFILGINAGNGSDAVTMTGSANLGALAIDLGNGDDSLTGGTGAIHTNYQRTITGGGGPGFDVLTNTDYFGDPQYFDIRDFEKML